MVEEATLYLEKSFLSPLLKREDITDISYNGGLLFYSSNSLGRKRSDIRVDSETVLFFLRQIANLTEKSINLANPILDVSFGRYRLNGVNSSVGRYKEMKAPSFSLRIASRACKIEKDAQFMDEKTKSILMNALKRKESIVIGGKTGTGKTELQKWLLLHLEDNTRVIVLDNVEELDLIQNERIDMTTWLSGEGNGRLPLKALIRNALRHNPDYLLVAEARGEEMLDALSSAGSGHPLITTIHADSLDTMPERLARMALMGEANVTLKELLEEVRNHIQVFVYLEKALDGEGRIVRFVRAIGMMDKQSGKIEKVFERRKDFL